MREQFETLEYGSIVINCGGRPYPLFEADINAYTKQRGNQDIANDFASYQSCNMTATLQNAPSVSVEITNVTSLTDLADFLNPITPNDGVICLDNWSIRVWDTIDPSVPTLTKVRGLNTAYTRLMTGRNKGNKDGYEYNNTVNPNARWDINNYVGFLQELWSNCWATNFLPASPSAWAPEHFRCFWIPRRWKNYYQLLPYRALAIEPLNGQRNVYNDNTNLPQLAQDTVTGVQSVFVASTDFFGNFQPGMGYPANSFATRTLRLDFSSVLGYPLIDSFGNKALLLKPLGVDSFYTNFFDSSRYELGCVTYNADVDAYPLLSELSAAQAQREFSPAYDHAGPWLPTSWARKVRTVKRSHRNSKKASTIRFFLRDKITKRISIFSRGEMRYAASTNTMPAHFLLHVDTNY